MLHYHAEFHADPSVAAGRSRQESENPNGTRERPGPAPQALSQAPFREGCLGLRKPSIQLHAGRHMGVSHFI